METAIQLDINVEESLYIKKKIQRMRIKNCDKLNV